MNEVIITVDNINYELIHPNECPRCHKSIVINRLLYGRKVEVKCIQNVYSCPGCNQLFITTYRIMENIVSEVGASYFRTIEWIKEPLEIEKEEIPEIISEISPKFNEIYSQAREAQKRNLHQICGPGYRKAFEFIIKDFAKLQTKDEKTKKAIENMFSGQVIEKYFENEDLKEVSKRVLWLGNDESHYLRIWENKDVDDMHNILQIAVYWISMHQLAKNVISEMEEKH